MEHQDEKSKYKFEKCKMTIRNERSLCVNEAKCLKNDMIESDHVIRLLMSFKAQSGK